jgi:hypothetical protein
MIFVDIETLILMFKTTYFNSQLTGAEIARILEVRYGQEKQKPITHARDSETD